VFDHVRNEILATAVGPINYEDIRAHLIKERDERGLSYSELIDARNAVLHVTSAEVQQIVSFLRELSQNARLGSAAVLVSTDVAYGMVRMLGMLVEDVCKILPFRDEQKARSWLESQVKGAK
jgi:hypothetical protein